MLDPALGSNVGYVDELYRRYVDDPESVSPGWRDFFHGYRPTSPGPLTTLSPASAAPAAVPVAELETSLPPVTGPAEAGAAPGVVPLKGVTARIAENMAESLSVPTATSVRTIAVRLLEEQRRLLNRHQAVLSGRKISFTHLVGWAVVRALVAHPGLNTRFVALDGEPAREDRPAINLGLAVDLERRGERLLLVPNIKDAGRLDFPGFMAAYDDLVARARAGKLTAVDFQDTTVSLTNPGTVGTLLSVPRLMAGQGLIVGVGRIGVPAEYSGAAPEVLAQLGIAKVMTLTSTYDHRVIQGAASGEFLGTVERLLLGGDGFYDAVFAELGVPHEPLAWTVDQNPPALGGPGNPPGVAKQAGVLQLIRAYRVRGHLLARLDPLGKQPVVMHPELELAAYGLTLWDLDREFLAGDLAGGQGQSRPLREILDTLRDTYCRNVGVEYMHIQDPAANHWLKAEMEATRNGQPLDRAEKLAILTQLNAAEAFERFLHTTYVGHKRFSLEGAETLIPMLHALLDAADGVGEVVMGMAHRGRLNVLANVLGKSHGAIFREFEGQVDPASYHGSGDVKYHLGATGTHRRPDGSLLRLTLASNPSHLEAVDPVVEGMTRARQALSGDGERKAVLPLLIHGDAAFAGQGVVAETLNLSQLPGYRTGGTLHLVVNNQIGFTTSPDLARSSRHATDIAKGIGAPIFHVNGDHPEDAVRMVRLALAFRQRFRRDVVVDLVCYRRWGHNEADEPAFTQPLMVRQILAHRSVRKLYTESLLRRGDIDAGEAERLLDDYQARLDLAFTEARAAIGAAPAEALSPAASAVAPQEPADTGVASTVLRAVLEGLDRVPEGFELHPKLARQLARARADFEEGPVAWATAEALAFGSLALEGVAVRLSGQDSGRGTFSQRNAILYDQATGEPFMPLNQLATDQAPVNIYDSLLSEFAVVGFEYGFSVAYPTALVLWEAQFGDFVNGAQVILDQFLAGAEAKWQQASSLVLLLPHGYEGQGPEHSSARLERFLQACAEDNLRVAVPSTPAQLFHLLRRQARSLPRRPLVVMSPKSLLRHPAATSRAAELTAGSFQPVLTDPAAPKPAAVRRVVLCAGKLYYDLREAAGGRDDLALLRVEQLYPFPSDALRSALAQYPAAMDVVWAQEEPRNMGAWSSLAEPIGACLAAGQSLSYAGRPAAASPATGSFLRHQQEQAAVLHAALGERTP